ncbi:hypothetical protein [Haladaptatus sp. NG-SE-30]
MIQESSGGFVDTLADGTLENGVVHWERYHPIGSSRFDGRFQRRVEPPRFNHRAQGLQNVCTESN